MSNKRELAGLMGALVALLSYSGATPAMMPPDIYEDLLFAADTHLQLAITDRDLVAPPRGKETGYGTCSISGIVVQVFRGPASMGDEVSFGVPCVHEGAQDVPIGGTVYTSVDRLGAAGFLEAVLTSDGNGTYALAARGMGARIIDRPSAEPVIDAGAGEAGGRGSTAALTGAETAIGGEVACTPGARVEVSSFGYWEKDATIEAGPDKRGRCLVRVGSLTGVWYTQHRLRRPGSDKALPEGTMANAGFPHIPEGPYLCSLAGVQFIADLSFMIEGDSYAMLADGAAGQIDFDPASQEVRWLDGIFAGLRATLQQEVDTGEGVITFPPESTSGTALDYGGNNIHCYLQDDL